MGLMNRIIESEQRGKSLLKKADEQRRAKAAEKASTATDTDRRQAGPDRAADSLDGTYELSEQEKKKRSKFSRKAVGNTI
jgi:hypothetical protein